MRIDLSSMSTILLLIGLVSAETVPAPAGLDEKTLHTAYMEGDFETVTTLIDAFARTHPTYSKEDSVFIAKHLAVIYTANPATREKGKHYMFRLLELLPSAKIVDMFVSEEIDRIFERVREEYAIRLDNLGQPSPNRKETDSPAPSIVTTVRSTQTQPPESGATRNKPPSRSRTLFWVAGGTALLAATGVLAFVLLSDSPASKDKVYAIPH